MNYRVKITDGSERIIVAEKYEVENNDYLFLSGNRVIALIPRNNLVVFEEVRSE